MTQATERTEMANKDLLTRLADAGEDAISKLHTPGADRLLGAVHSMRDRVDELQKKVRGIDDLEQRIAALEQQVQDLSRAKAKARRAPAKRTPTKRATRATEPEPSTASTPSAGASGDSSGSAESSGSTGGTSPG